MTLFLFLPVRKLATAAILPLGIAVWLLLLATLARKRLLSGAALLWIYLTSIPAVGDRVIGVLEDLHPPVNLAQLPEAEAALVLGGGAADARKEPPAIESTEAADRLEQGIRVVEVGKAPRLVLSGSSFYWTQPRYSEAEAMWDAAAARGIPPESLIALPPSENTEAEAFAMAQAARERGLRRIILVTSAFHMTRAALLFRRQGLDVIPFPTDYRRVKDRPARLLDFLPSAAGLGNTETAMKEFYGLLYYRLFPPDRR
ncbi:MAG: YdcF family protein [Bryobacteraceae bacterium]|nr:YdcF family protein [Bryobacteraceae bacterium]